MERVVPYHSSYCLGHGIDVTKNPSKTMGQAVPVSEDVKYTVAEPLFTTSQFSLVESMKDVCDIFIIPPEYVLKVETSLLKDDVIEESLKDLYKENSLTAIFRINFLAKKIYMPQEEKKSNSEVSLATATDGSDPTTNEGSESTAANESDINVEFPSDAAKSEKTSTHIVSALEIGNELVVILKIASKEREYFDKLSASLKETLSASRGILDEPLLSRLEKFATSTDKKLGKKHYQDVHCSIHYGSYLPLESYPSDVAGMVTTMRAFLDKCKYWKDILGSGVSPGVKGVNMTLNKVLMQKEKKSYFQTAKDYIFPGKDESNTSLKTATEVTEMGHAETHFSGSNVDGDYDSFIVLASNADHLYYTRATLQSEEPNDSELESFTSFALSQYPETSRDRFERIYQHLLHVNTAVEKLQGFFRNKRFISENHDTEGRQILSSVVNIHQQTNLAIEALDMITMPSEEFVDNLCSTNPLIIVNDFIENVLSKLPPGCDLDLLLIGKTGHGKSSTGNTILGLEKFKASDSAQSVTKSSSVAWSNVDGRILKVVDTPGVCDTDPAEEEDDGMKLAIHAMSEAITQCPGGFHALLLVIRYGQRMTKEERKAVGLLKCILGENVIQTHCVCVITHGDNFETENKGKKSFPDWCHEQTGFLADIFKECNYRCVLFNNKADDRKLLKYQLIELIARVDTLQSNGARYTNKLFEFAQQQREKVILEEKIPAVSQDMMRDIELVLDHLKTVAKNTEQRDRYAAELDNVRSMVDNLSNRVSEVEGEQVKLLVETVFSLAAVIHGEIDRIADEAPPEAEREAGEVGACGGDSTTPSTSPYSSLVNPELETQAKNLQDIHDNQIVTQNSAVNERVTEEVEKEINNNHQCFPAESTVVLRNGQMKRMEELIIGEEVMVRNRKGDLDFDTVYMFGHCDPDATANFIVLHIQGHDLSVSEDHLVFCVRDGIETCLPAQKITAGDLLMIHSGDLALGFEPVVDISRARKRGLYAPFTLSGTVVVDTAVMSCYVDVVSHDVAHFLLLPTRLLHHASPALLSRANMPSSGTTVPKWANKILKWM